MEAALDKMRQAKERMDAAGTRCADLDNLLGLLLGMKQAEALIPPDAMTARPGMGAMAIPVPSQEYGTLELFKGLWEFVRAGALGLGSVGYLSMSPTLMGLVGGGLGPFGCMIVDRSGQKSFTGVPTTDSVDGLIRQGVLGSLSVLQILGSCVMLVQLAPGDAMLEQAIGLVGCVMRAVWGSEAPSTQPALRQRLERQQWVPQLAAAGAQAWRAPPPRQALATSVRSDLAQHCQVDAESALDALCHICVTLRLTAGVRLQAPSKPLLQQLLCDSQALLAACPGAPAMSLHVTACVQAAELAIAASAWCGFDAARRQATLALLEEIRARADAENCWYSAAFASLILTSLCSNLAEGVAGPSRGGRRLRGAGPASASEAQALLQRAQQAAASVAEYKPRLKPWLPGGLQQVYAGWAASAASIVGQAVPGGAAEQAEASESLARGSEAFPVCSSCGNPSLHVRKCAACRSVAYCSRECQLADWKAGHKARCKAIAAERAQQEPREADA